MKKIIVLTVMVLLAVSLCMSTPEADKVNIDDADDKIVMSVGHFFIGHECSDGKAGFRCLLDAVKIILPGAGFSGAVDKKFADALALADKKGDLHKETLAAFHDLFKAMNSGKEFTFPTILKKPDDVMTYANNQLCLARKLLKDGQYAGSAKAILEVSIMIITPVKKAKKAKLKE